MDVLFFCLPAGIVCGTGEGTGGNGSFDSLHSLRTTDKWGKPSGFSVILSERSESKNP